MSKIFRVISFIIFFVLIFSGTAMAQSNTSISISIDGENVNYNDLFGFPFIDENNRTLVPFRITLEKAGAIVSWDNETKTAKAEKNGNTVLVKIGENFIVTNDNIVVIDTEAVIRNDRTYLPIRAVLEALEYKINWNNSTNTVEALYKNFTTTEIATGVGTQSIEAQEFDSKSIIDSFYGKDREPVEQEPAVEIIPYNNNEEKNFSATEATVKQLNVKGQLNDVVGFAQINNMVYYVDIEPINSIATQSPQFMLKTIDNNGTIKSIGEIFNLINWHPDDHYLRYVDLVRVKDMLILVTNCRLFYFDFNTNRFEYLDRQSDVDFFEEALTDNELSIKSSKIHSNQILFDYKDRGGWIKNVFVSENKLYLLVYPAIHLSSADGEVPPELENEEISLMDSLVVIDPYKTKEEKEIIMYCPNEDYLTVDENDNLMAEESYGLIRAFNKQYYYDDYYYNEDLGEPGGYYLEERLNMQYENVSYHTPLFYNDKLLLQSALGLVYLDTSNGLAYFNRYEYMYTKNNVINPVHFWLIETEDIYFGYDEFDNRSTRILEWCIGQDGNIYALADTLANKESLMYHRLIKIIPPRTWNVDTR